MKIKLAEALLRRKELQNKVSQLHELDHKELYEVRARRQKIEDGIDDILANVPLVKFSQLTAAYDYHAKRLRQIDSAIQRANWETDVEIDETVMEDFVEVEPDAPIKR